MKVSNVLPNWTSVILGQKPNIVHIEFVGSNSQKIRCVLVKC